MEKIWLGEYPPGVPREIDPNTYTSIISMFEEGVGKFANLPAFSNFGTTLSFSDIDDLSRKFAAYLQQDLGIVKGDRVAIMAANMLQYPVAVFGIMRAGAITVNVNPLYTPRELEHQLNDAGVKAIVIFSNSTPTLAEVIENTPVKHVIVTRLGDLLNESIPSNEPDDRLQDCVEFKDALEKGKELTLEAPDITGEDVLFLQYTGGTTGLSKGATLTHRNLVANLLQYNSWFAAKQEKGKETILTALPLYHIFALHVCCLTPVLMGTHSVLITNPRDLPGILNAFKQWKFTMMAGVNTLYNGLLHGEGFKDLDFSLKICIGGGAAVQQAVAERWFEITGCHILEGYGLSETSPLLTINRVDTSGYTGSIGLPVPSTEISLRDDNGNEVAAGDAGELCAKGPQVMRGYWNREDATRDAMTEDGFFKTGDIAVVDERGYFKIVDRKKDMILVSGFNVFPNEIEDVVAKCAGVQENSCIGIPDARSGEAVKVYVVKQPGAEITPKDVIAHCRVHLTGYKVPKHVEFIDALPKSNVGKILRRELREMALSSN